jgi:hypothetical protein
LSLTTVHANGTWLVCAVVALNLTHAPASIAGGRLAKATTGTSSRTLITVPARVASSDHFRVPSMPWHLGAGRSRSVLEKGQEGIIGVEK